MKEAGVTLIAYSYSYSIGKQGIRELSATSCIEVEGRPNAWWSTGHEPPSDIAYREHFETTVLSEVREGANIGRLVLALSIRGGESYKACVPESILHSYIPDCVR